MRKMSVRGPGSKRDFFFAFQMLLSLLAVALLSAGCARTPKHESEHDRMMESLSLYETGLDLEMENDLAAARAAYEQSLAVSPRPIVHYRLGVLLTQLGEYEQALEHLDRALELVPSLTIAEREKVRVQALMQIQAPGERPPAPPAEEPVFEVKPAPAVEQISPATPAPPVAEALPEESVETGKSQPEVELALARGYEAAQQGDLDSAIQIYQDALASAPDEPRLYYNLGNLHQRQEKYKEAYVKYQRAIDLDPDYGRAWNNLGFVLERLSRSDEALECYEQAMASGVVLEAYYNSALLLEKKGRLEEALERFRAFLSRGGAGEQADSARGHIQRLERHF